MGENKTSYVFIHDMTNLNNLKYKLKNDITELRLDFIVLTITLGIFSYVTNKRIQQLENKILCNTKGE